MDDVQGNSWEKKIRQSSRVPERPILPFLSLVQFHVVLENIYVHLYNIIHFYSIN